MLAKQKVLVGVWIYSCTKECSSVQQYFVNKGDF